MTPWTPEEVAAWVAMEDATGQSAIRRWHKIWAPELVEAWRASWSEGRAHIVRRAPECDDYPRLRDDLLAALNFPLSLAPPDHDSQRALIDRGLALLWSRVLEPESVSDGQG